jgi:DNA-binding response OmpR family regulator
VDDNVDAARTLAMMLELEGHETQVAYDAEEALRLARAEAPDAVFLDIGLPQTNGYEVCRTIRSHDWGKNMTLVALTGWGQEEDRRRSLEAGFDCHLVKPVELSALEDVLNGAKGAAAR